MKSKVISSAGLMDLTINALDHKLPFSMVSVGATEAFVLAQYTLMTEKYFMKHPEAYVASMGHKRGFDHRGIRFPNAQARDDAVSALQKADAIGVNIVIKNWNVHALTEAVLDHHKLWPKFIFEAYLRHVIMFSQSAKFARMLAGRRILIICGYADEVKAAMEKTLQKKLGFTVAGTIKIEEYEDIPRVKGELSWYDFDLCLLAAGINAVILGPHISTKYGKVAFDIGQGMESFITGEIETAKFLEKYIGLNKLMKM